MTGMSEAAEPDRMAQLLGETGRGDRAAFAELYGLSAARLYPIALRLLRSRDAADDVLQEAYVLIWRKADRYEAEKGRPLAWMATVVRNCAIDRLRREKRESSRFLQTGDALEDVADPLLSEPAVPSHVAASMRACLRCLDDNQRRAILLAYHYGMTHEELADHFGAPLGTVKSWVRRGLLKLRDCLEQ